MTTTFFSDDELAAAREHIERVHQELLQKEQAERADRIKATKLEPIGQVRARLNRYHEVAAEIHNGITGVKRFSWRGVDVQHCMPIVRAMGITLITKSRAAKLGFTLKRGAAPVGAMYFGAPISRMADVYVLECQFNRKDDSGSA